MTRLTGRTTSSTRREIAAIVAEWERGQLNRRSLLRRAAMMGLGSAALATLVGREATGRASAAVLRTMQDDPAAGVRGGTLRVATIGEPPHPSTSRPPRSSRNSAIVPMKGSSPTTSSIRRSPS
ncbi:MAG: hypothetical protein K0Q89_2965 [Thermomicrobiales bacterium]|nr:hypothetical protein [Thermomicrobiales bacterium]